MTLADELRDVIARDDAFALRLLVRANESTILRAVQLLDRLAIAALTSPQYCPHCNEYMGESYNATDDLAGRYA